MTYANPAVMNPVFWLPAYANLRKDVLVYPGCRDIEIASGAKVAGEGMDFHSVVGAIHEPFVSFTFIEKPSITFVQRYDVVFPFTRYSRLGIIVVVRYCLKMSDRSIPELALMYFSISRAVTV